MAAKTTKKAQKASEVTKKSRKKAKTEEVDTKGSSEQIKASDVKIEQSHMESVMVGTEPVEQAVTLLCLKPDELWKMRYSEAESRASQKDAIIAQLTKKMILMQIDPKSLIAAEEAKIEAAQNAANAARNEYRRVMASASARLGVNLSGCAIDPDTGVVVPQN